MKNKFMIKLFVGLMLVLFNFSTIVYANENENFILQKATFKIVANGQTYSDDTLPILAYDGNTYVPLKKLGTLLNTQVKWNDKLNQVEINSLNQTTTKIITGGKSMQVFNYEGKDYIYIREILNNYNGYFDYNENQKMCLWNSSQSFLSKESPLLTDISYQLINDRVYFEYDYFVNTIQPLLKGQL